RWCRGTVRCISAPGAGYPALIGQRLRSHGHAAVPADNGGLIPGWSALRCGSVVPPDDGGPFPAPPATGQTWRNLIPVADRTLVDQRLTDCVSHRIPAAARGPGQRRFCLSRRCAEK